MALHIDTSPDALWKKRFRAPSIYFTTIAPLAPQRGLVWTNLSGSLQIHAWDVPGGELRQLTHTPGGHSSFPHLSPDGRWVYYLKDEHGSEIGHYVRIPYEGEAAPEDITPDVPPYSSFSINFSRDGSRMGYITAGADGFSVFIADVDSSAALSAPRPLYHSKTIAFGPMFSADGRVAFVASSEHTGKNEFSLLAFDAATGQRIAELWDGEGYSINLHQTSPQPGDPRMIGTTTLSGIERLLIWNPLTGERRDLELDIPGAQLLEDWSEDGRTLLISAISQAEQSLYIHDLTTGQTRRLPAPAGQYSAYFTPGSSRSIFAVWNDAAHNGRLVELDAVSGAFTRTVLAPGDVPPGREWQSVSFPSSDGQMIQGWLCLPEGASGPVPTILETHGGPTGVTGNGFAPGAQAWVDHGFAFLSINYRGSITFGREFEQKIWHDLGHWEVEDMAAARDWLVREGIADPAAIFLTGWSYGGYLTLLGLGKRPDLWAGGMAGIAIADWAVQWEDTADTLRGYQEALFGGTPQDVPERYRAASPITYAEQVRAPVLIIQGRSDTRTPARPVRMYEQKMKDLGKDITVHWYDTGHAGSFADVNLSISHAEMMMCFAAGLLK